MWKDILKIHPITVGRTTVGLKTMPEDEDCCEVARTSLILAINSSIGHKREKKDFPKGADITSKRIQKASCEKIKEFLAHHGKITKYPSGIPAAPKGKRIHPFVVKCRKIYEEWKECDKDLV